MSKSKKLIMLLVLSGALSGCATDGANYSQVDWSPAQNYLNQLNQPRPVQSTPQYRGIDQTCYGHCRSLGMLIPYCRSQCSY